MGVGAELPEKQAKSGPGELKLKNKMLGKKRAREETDSNDTAAKPTSDDDEEDSKAKVIQKKPRLDPFAPSKKKGKGLNVPTIVPPHKLAGSSSAVEAKPEDEKAVATPVKGEDIISLSKNIPNAASTPE